MSRNTEVCCSQSIHIPRRVSPAISKVTPGSWTELVYVELTTIPHQYLPAVVTAAGDIITKTNHPLNTPIVLMGM